MTSPISPLPRQQAAPRSNGLTVSLTSSVVATRNVARETKRTGRNPGTLNLKRSQPVDDAWARKSGVR